MSQLRDLFEKTESTTVERYVTNTETNSINYVRLGYFLEIIELGTFEIKGGENPMVFIRINDPSRIERDSNNSSYSNSLLSKTLERHDLSNQIFDHFFLRSFTNADRWDFIEDFFLGSDVDLLLDKYKGGDASNIDIIEALKKTDLSVTEVLLEGKCDYNVNIFYPDSEKYYFLDNPLTISNENGIRTKKVSEWLSEDPLAFDIVRKTTPFQVNKDVFDILISRLNAHHPGYVKKVLGLKLKIEFKGYSKLVHAIVPYNTKPVEFYKWWCSNKEDIVMTLDEQTKLFIKVYRLKPSVLKSEHKKLINKA